MENLKFITRFLLALACVCGVLMCSQCEAQTPTLQLTATPTQIGVSITASTHYHNGVELHPDSIVLFWTCDPYQGQKDLFHQQLLVGDTLWLPSDNYFQGFALVCYPNPILYWKASFSKWSTNTWFQSSNNIAYQAQEQPSIVSHIVNQQEFTINSNAKITRVMIFSYVYGQVYWHDFNGVEGQNNSFTFTKTLAPGLHTLVIRGKYSNQCKECVTIRYPFTIY